MGKKIFTKSTKILIVTLLLLVAILQERSQLFTIIAVLIWLTVLIGYMLVQYSSGFIKKLSAWRFSFFPSHIYPANLQSQPELVIVPEKTAELPDADQEIMLRHIALRISDKLKSAYPNATWQWQNAVELKNILRGQIIRISVENMEQYTHADVSFNRYGCIHIEPLIVGTFVPQSIAPTELEDTTSSDPQTVDVSVWYELIGQKVLEEVITELNAKGHSQLKINKNGDIVINYQKKEIVQATLKSFPSTNYWEEFISILHNNELKGKIAGDYLQISWL